MTIEYSPIAQPVNTTDLWRIEAALAAIGVRTLAGYPLPLDPDHAARVLAKALRRLGGPGSGNFGHAGRPGQIGGSSHRATWQPGILSAIQQADGGFTYNPVTGQSPTTGFALSLYKDREQVLDVKDVNLVTLATYAQKNNDLLTQSSNYMGGWHNPDNDKVYLDVSTVVQSAAEAERLGRQANQLAYFDLSRGQSVTIEESHVKAAAAYASPDRAASGSAIARRSYRARESLDRTRTYARRNRTGPQDLLHTTELTALGGPGSGHHGHAGRPGSVGGSAPHHGISWEMSENTPAAVMRARELPPTLIDAENLIRNQANEHGYLVKDGKPAQYFGSDKVGTVDLGSDALYGTPEGIFWNQVFTHNHPSATALSPSDGMVAATHNMKEIRAVIPDGTFRLTREGESWPHPDVFWDLINTADRDVHNDFIARIAEGTLTIDEANKRHWPAVWPKVVTDAQTTAPNKPISFSFEPKKS